MTDCQLVLAHAAPGDSIGAAQALRSLHNVLVPTIGWEASRQTFVFLTRGPN